MAEQLINSYTSKGLFNALMVGNTMLKSNESVAEFYTDLTDCKDSVSLIVYIPAIMGGNFYLTFKSAEGGKDKKITLVSEETNFVRFDTKGIKDENGFGHFAIEVSNGMSVTESNVSVLFVKNIDVVNN